MRASRGEIEDELGVERGGPLVLLSNTAAGVVIVKDCACWLDKLFLLLRCGVCGGSHGLDAHIMRHISPHSCVANLDGQRTQLLGEMESCQEVLLQFPELLVVFVVPGILLCDLLIESEFREKVRK